MWPDIGGVPDGIRNYVEAKTEGNYEEIGKVVTAADGLTRNQQALKRRRMVPTHILRQFHTDEVQAGEESVCVCQTEQRPNVV